MKFGRKLMYDITHLALGMYLQYLGKLKIQIFCRCGRKRKHVAFLIASNCYSTTNVDIFGVRNSESFPILIAN